MTSAWLNLNVPPVVGRQCRPDAAHRFHAQQAAPGTGVPAHHPFSPICRGREPFRAVAHVVAAAGRATAATGRGAARPGRESLARVGAPHRRHGGSAWQSLSQPTFGDLLAAMPRNEAAMAEIRIAFEQGLQYLNQIPLSSDGHRPEQALLSGCFPASALFWWASTAIYFIATGRGAAATATGPAAR
jgi:hypothetical protein